MDTEIRSMCLTGRLDADLTSTLTSRSSRPLVDFLVREMGKRRRKHEEKKVGETKGKKLLQIFWDPVTFDLSIKRPETATWFVYPTWMIVNVSVWESTHQSSINSLTAREAKQMQAQWRVEMRPECDHFTHPCCFSTSLCKWLTLINSNSPDRDRIHRLRVRRASCAVNMLQASQKSACLLILKDLWILPTGMNFRRLYGKLRTKLKKENKTAAKLYRSSLCWNKGC